MLMSEQQDLFFKWFSTEFGPLVDGGSSSESRSMISSQPLVPESQSMIPSKRLATESRSMISSKGLAPESRSMISNKRLKISVKDNKLFPHSKPKPKPKPNHFSSSDVDPTENAEVVDENLTYRVALQDLSQPTSEATPPDGLLAVPLMRHQRIALSWMVYKETASLHCSGGILADDQGLGKTISTIALILTQRPPTTTTVKQEDTTKALNLDDDGTVKSEDPCILSTGRPWAGTLIVCPTSVLRQWAEELRNKVTDKANLSVLVYHGSNRRKDPLDVAKYDVVITTYSIVSQELPNQPLADEDGDERIKTENLLLSSSKKRMQDPPNFSGSERVEPEEHLLSTCKNRKDSPSEKDKGMVAGPLAKVGWFRVVLDEAQSIKNHRTQVARACWGLRAKRRWCLSGTPIQNAIDDLYSYFRFLRYDPYATYNAFRSLIKLPINRDPKIGYKKLQVVLKTIMLRRTKDTKIDGEPIISLPPKSVELKKLDFSKEERDFYFKLEADSQAQFNAYQEAGTVQQNYGNLLLMLLRLRQACDHPFLVKRYDSYSVWTTSLEMAKTLPKEKQEYLLSCLKARSAICGRCSDSPEEAVVTLCGHVFCHQCISEHLTGGDDNLCPATLCKSRLNANSVFSSATLETSLFGDCSGPQINEAYYSYSQGFYSSKIRSALEVLESISSKTTEKAIVFSQWTGMLDLVETRLKNSSIQYRRLDGTMSVVSRERAVKDFNTIPEVSVMIMSLKAASLGLNMVAACHVLLLDLWWNPTTEDQAIDRAHRIGQTRPVKVLRLTVEDTVEDRILALQQKKREMVASAFGEDEKGNRKSRLTVEELKFLFMGSG